MSGIQFIKLQTQGLPGLQALDLKDGSSVAVNVLKNNGDGTYLVSFAGSRFNVKSKIPLENGQKFVAKLSVRENKVFLSPQKSLNQIQETENSALLSKISQNADLSKILAEFGLVPDSITIKIMQFLQQGNFSLDKNLMKKARIIALNFPGNEKKAAEIAISLFEKGVNANVQLVKKILDSFFASSQNLQDLKNRKNLNDNSDFENSKNQQNLENQKKNSSSKEQNKEQNFSQQKNSSRQSENFEQNQQTSSQTENLSQESKLILQSETSFQSKNPQIKNAENQKNLLKNQQNQNFQTLLKNLYGSVPENSPGLLSLFNQISEKSEKHWILLPYEWNFTKKDGKSAKSNGFIRLLLNKSLKTVEKISVNCEIKNSPKKWTNYFFVLYLNSSKVKEVRFCTLPTLLTSQISFEEKRLGELFSSGMNSNDSVTVTYSPLTLIEGLFADSEIPAVFNKLI